MSSSTYTPVVVIHGGAWAIPDDLVDSSLKGVARAAQEGYKVLTRESSCRSALDAVEAAVRCLENDPAFDAGVGSVLNMEGEVEMDAIIMDGENLNFGSVACVQNIRHPVSLARKVMDFTDHNLLVGKGANQFAAEMKVETASREDLVTSEAIKQYEEYTQYKATIKDLFNNSLRNNGHDTVGAVAMDVMGNIACATSTGGITLKRVGRVGDSPIVGCGAYCDNSVGGVSTTGHGESIMKVTLARLVLQHMENGLTTQKATEAALEYMEKRVSGAGGVIAIGCQGDVGKHFTTERMAWACIKDGQLQYGILPNQVIVEKL